MTRGRPSIYTPEEREARRRESIRLSQEKRRAALEEEGCKKIFLEISGKAHKKLTRLCKKHQLSQREMIERLILDN